MKNIINITLLLLFPILLNAQGGGLFGKKLTVFYNLDYHGSSGAGLQWLRRNNESENQDYEVANHWNMLNFKKFSHFRSIFNFKHTLTADYAFNRQVALGGHVSTTRDAFDVRREGNFSGNIPTHTKNVSDLSFGIHTKLFNVRKKGAMAPLGNYFLFKIDLHNTKISYTEAQNVNAVEAGEESTKLGFGFGFGKQIILYKRVLLNLAVDSNWWFTEDSPGGAFDNPFAPEGFYDTREANLQMFSNDVIRLTIGVGFAAF